MHQAAKEQGETRPDAIDLAHLERATFGDRGLAREVLRLFDKRCDTLLREIVHAPDAGFRIFAAHTLKGAAKGIGAFPVADAAQAVEDNAGNAAEAISVLSARLMEARLAVGEFLRRE
jgi:HPt (histidine-containing phosphotransfer) domain-containing protein